MSRKPDVTTAASGYTGATGARPEGTDIKKWADSRAAARAAAKAKLDEMRQGAIAALAKKSRKEARERGAVKFIGLPCERHDNAERYVKGGGCVLCVQEKNAAKRGKTIMPIKLRESMSLRNLRPPVVGRFHPNGPKPQGNAEILLLEVDDRFSLKRENPIASDLN